MSTKAFRAVSLLQTVSRPLPSSRFTTAHASARSAFRRLESTSRNTIKDAADSVGPINTANLQPPPSSPSITSKTLQLLAAPARAYERAQHRRPYVVQLSVGVVIYFLGDLSAQYIQRKSQDESTSGKPAEGFFAKQYDPVRSLRNVIIGAGISLPSYHWFLYLGTIFNFQNFALSLACKVVFNQIVLTPVLNSYFFGMQSLLSGLIPSSAEHMGEQRPPASLLEEPMLALSQAGQRIADALPISVLNSCKFWPLVTAFSFTFVKPQHRNVFSAVAALFWQSYLGMLNQRAIEKEGHMEVPGAQIAAA